MIRSRHRLRLITVRRSPLQPSLGWLAAGPLRLRAALGKGGVHVTKREGDGRTPVGTFPLQGLWLRPDSSLTRATGLTRRFTRPDDLWCDDAAHRRYNQPCKAPLRASHEEMWRKDGLYDGVIEIGWNMKPAIRGRGSAIFLHLARPGYEPTAGCVALARNDFIKLLPRLAQTTRIKICR